MAFGLYELRFVLGVQSYGTGNIARLRRDIEALSRTTDIANQRSLAQARAAQAATRVARLTEEQRLIRNGTTLLEARNASFVKQARAQGQGLNMQARSMDLDRRMFDLGTKRLVLEKRMQELKMKTGTVLDQKIVARGLESVAMQEAILTKNTEALNFSLKAQEQTIRQLRAEHAKLASQHGASSAGAKKLQADIHAATAAYKAQTAAVEQLNLAEKMAPTQRRQLRMRELAHAGRMLQFTGLLGTAAFAGMSASAAGFNRNVTLAATQARQLNAPISQVAKLSVAMEDQIMGLMQRFPASSQEIADSAYEIFSSMTAANGGVLTLAGGMRHLETANKIAVAGGADLADSTSAMITILNNFGGSAQKNAATIDTMFDIIRFGRMHISEFNSMMNKVAPAAKTANQSLEDIGGSMAFLTRVIPSQPQVATGLARLLQAFQHPRVIAGLKEMGIEIEDSQHRLIPFVDIIEKIVAKFPELAQGSNKAANFFRTVTKLESLSRTGRPGEGLFFTEQGRRVFFQALQHVKDLRIEQEKIVKNKDEFDSAFDALKDAPGVQWAIFTNSMKALIIQIGRDAMPIFLAFGEQVRRLVGWFSEHKEVAKWFALIGAGTFIVSLLGGTLANIGFAIAAFTLQAKLNRIALDDASASAGRLGLMMRGLAGVGIISIPIIMQVIRGGDPGGWALLSGALSGAVGGAMIGSAGGPLGAAVGAGIGAITVPVVLHLVSKLQKDDKELSFAKKAYAEYFKDFYSQVDQREGVMSFKEWLKENEDLIARHRQAVERWSKSSKKPMDAWTKAQIKSMNEWKKANGKSLEEYENMLDNANKKTDDSAKQAVQQAEDMASQLSQVFDQFRQQNEQTFGQLFSGPFFQSETWNLAKEWGVEPSIRELNKDLSEQIQQFTKYRNAIDALGQKGAPAKLIQELQGLGPEALPYIEALRVAAPKEFNKFVAMWQQKHKMIEDATKIDFSRQLSQWRRFGEGIAQSIINGLRTQDPALDAAFKQYITSKFPGVMGEIKRLLREEIKKEQAVDTIRRPRDGNGNVRVDRGGDTNLTIYQTPPEDTKDVIKRSAWELKNLGRSISKSAAKSGGGRRTR